MKHGELITTPFGDGIVLGYRQEDGVYEVELPFGTMYFTVKMDDDEHAADNQPLEANPVSVSLEAIGSESPSTAISTAELNIMYESLEKMRRLNLEMACEERGIPYDEECLHQCYYCLMERPLSPKSKSPRNSTDSAISSSSARFPRLRQLVDVHKRQVEQLAKHSIRKSPKPCLICSAPSCHKHASAAFAKQNITLCLPCEHLFSVDYIVECLTAPSPEDRRFLMDRMVDVYDRTMLLLRYSSQYMEEAARGLEASTEHSNRVSLGSSGVGVVSGVLGVCAAATILTPAGPPLLVASLLFGGSATAVQTSTDLRNYYSEPNQLADRVIALHGMVSAILRIAKSLHDIIMRDHLYSGMYEEEEQINDTDAAIVASSTLEKGKQFESRAMAGMTASRAAAASVEIASLAGVGAAGTSMTAVAETAALNAGLLNRSGMVLLRTARVARFAGGALSAATVMLEAKCMNDTLARMRAGNPCEKAEIIRKIAKEIDFLPVTNELSADVDRFLAFMARRRRNMSEEEAREAMRVYEEQKQMDNTLMLVSEEDEDHVLEQNNQVDAFLASDPVSHSEEHDALPASAADLTSGTSISDHVEAHKTISEPPGGRLSKPNWDQARASVVGAGGELASSLRGGFSSLRNQAQLLRSRRTKEEVAVKKTPVGSVKMTKRSGGASDADRSFDESLTA